MLVAPAPTLNRTGFRADICCMTRVVGFMAPATEPGTLDLLADALAAERSAVWQHSQRVARLAGLIARACPSLDEPPERVELGALLHDLGKLALPLALLSKPAVLTATEHAIVQAHPSIGAQLIATSGDNADVADLVRAHHERVDGRGYPNGLHRSQIRTGAQIIAISDSWDAMTSARTYRAPLTFEAAAHELRLHAGRQWRPDLVRLALDILRDRHATTESSPTRVGA